MVAPSGLVGVQRVPKAGQSTGFFNPCKMDPAIHISDSLVWMNPTSKRVSASKSVNSSRSFHPLIGISPMPRQFRSQGW